MDPRGGLTRLMKRIKDCVRTRPFIPRRRQGQSLVELALAGPVLALMFCVIADVGRVWYLHVSAANAVREGARVAMDSSQVDSNVQAAVRRAAPGITFTSITASPGPGTGSTPRSSAPGGNPSGQQVTVSAAYNFSSITPVVRVALGNPKTITVSAQMTML